MKIKLLDRYILSQVFIACFGFIFIFMIIWIMPEIFLKTVQRTMAGQYTIETAASIILFELPKVLNIALPVGMLLGTVIVFDKLSKDFEITVMRGSGFPFFRIIISVIILSVFASFFTFIVEAKFLPYSACKLKDIKENNRVSQFVFPLRTSDGAMKKMFIVPNFDDNYIRDVIVLNFYDNSEKGSSLLSSILISDYIKYNNGAWTINTAKQYNISEDGVYETTQEVKNVKVLDGVSGQNAYKLMKYSIFRDRELTNHQIYEYVNLLHQEKMDDEYRFMLNKYIQRYTHAFMCILFAILGSLLGFSKPREQKFLGMLIAVGVIFLYYITMPFFDMLAEKDFLSPWITSMIAPIAAIILIIYFKKAKDL